MGRGASGTLGAPPSPACGQGYRIWNSGVFSSVSGRTGLFAQTTPKESDREQSRIEVGTVVVCARLALAGRDRCIRQFFHMRFPCPQAGEGHEIKKPS